MTKVMMIKTEERKKEKKKGMGEGSKEGRRRERNYTVKGNATGKRMETIMKGEIRVGNNICKNV